MLRIAVCDDEKLFLDYEKQVMIQYLADKNVEGEVCTFDSAAGLLQTDTQNYDLIFLDMDMLEMNGMELAVEIRNRDVHAEIAFITVMVNLATWGYKVHAFRYIIKNLNCEYDGPICECLDSFLKEKQIRETRLNFDFLEGSREIFTGRIVYVECVQRLLSFFVIEGNTLKTYTLKGRMSDLKYLEEFSIMPIHKSILVNYDYVQNLKRYQIELRDGLGILDVGQPRYEEVFRSYLDYRSRHK